MSDILSGQKAVTTAGTELHLAAAGVGVNCCVAVKALAANTGLMFVGEATGAGVVASGTGYQLAAAESVILENVDDLYNIMVDSAVNGEGVCWLILGRH